MRLREAVVGAIAAFAINWVWENAQAPLYMGYAGFARDVWMCTVAALGDVVIVALIYTAVAALWRDHVWHRRPSLARYAAAAAVGLAIAVAVELWALATHRWAYGAMPLVPGTGVGLLPILQMLAIPPLVFTLMRMPGRSAAGTGEAPDR